VPGEFLSLRLVIVLPIGGPALGPCACGDESKDAATQRMAGSALARLRPVPAQGDSYRGRRLAAACCLADIWSVNLMTMADRGLGQRISGALLGILVILLLSVHAWQFARPRSSGRCSARAACPHNSPTTKR
jgi:hypothetical protein